MHIYMCVCVCVCVCVRVYTHICRFIIDKFKHIKKILM